MLTNMFAAISTDAWIQTIGGVVGAALGAYLGGRYASKLATKQMKEQMKIDDFKSLNTNVNFVVSYCRNLGIKTRFQSRNCKDY